MDLPALVVIAASNYGILSTIVNVAIQHGYTSGEAVTSHYLFSFLLARCYSFSHSVHCRS